MRIRNFLFSLGLLGILTRHSFGEVNIGRLVEFLEKKDGVVSKTDTIQGIPREMTMRLDQMLVGKLNIILLKLV